jgi:hypothetical protein
LSAGTLVAVGDGIAQLAIERRAEYDWKRTGRMFAFGLCVSGPTMHFWYGFLGKRITGSTPLIRGLKVRKRNVETGFNIEEDDECFYNYYIERLLCVMKSTPPRSLISIFCCFVWLVCNFIMLNVLFCFQTMLIDQTVYAPFIITCFFTFTSFLEGLSPAQIGDKLKKNFGPSIKGNYLLWPAAQLVNFTFVPTRLAVLYVSGVSVVWNTWLCYTSAKDKHD